MHIRCTACGYTVSPSDANRVRLLADISTWINYVVSLHVAQGKTASFMNNAPKCPPCPSCRSVRTWVNVVEGGSTETVDGLDECPREMPRASTERASTQPGDTDANQMRGPTDPGRSGHAAIDGVGDHLG